MPSNQAGDVGRTLSFQAVHYLRKTINYNDVGIASGVPLSAPLPAGAQILPLASTITIETAFNAGTTNNLLIGTTAGGNDICATADSAAGTAGTKTLALSTIAGKSIPNRSAAQQLYVAYTQTGTAASAGKATVSIAYTISNDQ